MHVIRDAPDPFRLTAQSPDGSAQVFVELRTGGFRDPRFPVSRGEDDVVVQAGVGGGHAVRLVEGRGWHPCRGA